jgi:hypothetical protein
MKLGGKQKEKKRKIATTIFFLRKIANFSCKWSAKHPKVAKNATAHQNFTVLRK